MPTYRIVEERGCIQVQEQVCGLWGPPKWRTTRSLYLGRWFAQMFASQAQAQAWIDAERRAQARSERPSECSRSPHEPNPIL